MTDINELFQRDPTKLTDDDITAIVAKFREVRHTFNSAPKPATKSGGAPKKLTAAQQAAQNLDLGDFKL